MSEDLRTSVDEERLEFRYPTRRGFFRLMGGGITVFFTVRQPAAVAQRREGFGEYPEDFNAYLRIGEDGRVSCFTGKIEMGQGIVTSLAQMLAEELEVPLSSVDMVMGDTARCPVDRGTFGSRSTKYFGPYLRRAAAEAKAVLIQLAGEQFGISQTRLIAQEGVIADRQEPSRKVSYAELAKGARIERHLEGEALIKPHTDHKISGRSEQRRDSEPKVTGKAQYAGDIHLPGMLYARILRPPAHGAKLKTLDLSSAREVNGINVMQDGELIAVLHQYADVAESALDRVKAEYEISENALDNSTIFAHLLDSGGEQETVSERGKLEEGRALSVKSFETTFYNQYVAHAPMETHTAVASLEGDNATVWVSTQAPFRVQEEVAETLRLPPQNVRVVTPFVGGGFGGKTRSQQAIEAARLAKLSGHPVQVAWSRKEEFFYDTFRPASVVTVRSGLSDTNRIVNWEYEVFFAGTRSSQPPYDIPHLRILSRGRWTGATRTHPFGVGAWRGPGSNTNVFAIESQIDIMSEVAGLDPVEFRLENLRDERMKRVLETAAEKFGHKFSRIPSGKGVGVVCTDYLGTYVAAAAEVEVDKNTGKIRVVRVVCVQDMGEIINPQGAQLQIEGCITMGLGYVLSEEIHFRGGKILDQNFDTYRIPRFSWLPRIEVVLIDNPEMPPQGCGEPSITCMGALIANAVYDAVGVRLFELPMTAERVRKAIQAG